MSSNSPTNPDSQEIDLSKISEKIEKSIKSFLTLIFKGFFFIKRNIIFLTLLFIIGAVLGYFIDKKTKVYNHEIVVTPNFGSTEYLYSKIDLIQAKLREGDTSFLKKIGINPTMKFSAIEIKPIVDVYKFIDSKPENFELIKLMAEDGNINKIIDDPVTSKNYPYHKITYTTHTVTNETKTLNPLMNFLNDGDYFKEVQKIYLKTIANRLKTNDSIIYQIDKILNDYSSNRLYGSKNDKLVYYNENTQLNEIIKTKSDLLKDQANIQMEFLNLDSVIKMNSSVLNIKNTESINGKMKFVFPFVFIFIFIFICIIKALYIYQKEKI